MSYREVMSLPIRTFWLMSSNINRLFAERDMRLLSVFVAANNSEGMSDKIKELTQELGSVTRFEETLDVNALMLLRDSL